MEKSIYKYILLHTKKDQIWLSIIAIASFPMVYVSLDIPKIIVNNALGGGGSFEILGFDLTQIEYLLMLSLIFLAMVIINGGMKFIHNVYRGVVGERMLRRFRYTLYTRILRFPLPHFKNVSSSEIIPMVTAETEPLGGFIGDSFALPVMQGGLLITYLSFIFVQDVWLGLAAIALYPPQMYLIPRLQHKVNLLSKERVQTVRKLADRIGESVTGITDIHANDTGHFERADISQRLGTIFLIRNEIFRRKFFIKFLNNFLAQLTPFFFFSIGGYLVIQRELSLGALVAVLAGYKEISPPWKELLKFYQITEDVKVKYAQIIEQFAPDGMLSHKLLMNCDTATQSDSSAATPLAGDIRAGRLSYVEESATQVDKFNFQIGSHQHSVILSKDGSGGDELTQLLARLLSPTSGSLHIGEADLATLPESVTGRRIGYCSATSRLFNATIRDNLYYGLKHQPIESTDQTTSESAGDTASDTTNESAAQQAAVARRQIIKEARATSNSTQDINADWVDIHQTGATSQAEFMAAVHAVINCVELDDELLTLALRTVEDIDIPELLAEQIVTLRSELIERINKMESGAIIEPLDPKLYIHNLTVEENLLFGTPVGGLPAADFLAGNSLIKEILRDSGLEKDLDDIGLELAGLMVELFSDVPDDSELFDQFSFIKADELPEYQQLVATANAGGRGGEDGVSVANDADDAEAADNDDANDAAANASGASANSDNLNEEQRAKLRAVSLKLCPARHRLELVTPQIQEKVIKARTALMEELGDDNSQILFFNRERYNHGMSVQENLLFGRIAYSKGHLQPRVTETIRDTLKSTNINQSIVMAGLNCPTGAGGAKLSAIVRQKLVLARALLKNPDILIINNALSGLDGKSFARILDRVIALRQGRNLIWVLNDAALLPRFAQVLIVEKSKLIHHDSPESLSAVIEGL